ncbi:RnfABCDGE type electron transport complex subunit G [Candidatus Latescibacterota bacterium]
MRDILKLGAVLMTYALLAGSSLAFVNDKTSGLIIENKLIAETAARSEVLPGMSGGFDARDGKDGLSYWIGWRDEAKSDIGGFLIMTSGNGYSSVIESMVGVDTAGNIIGVKVISQQETPGLGTKIQEIRHGESDPWFTRQYIGRTADDDISVAKDGGTIDAITGATISSRALTNSINRGLRQLMETLGGEL